MAKQQSIEKIEEQFLSGLLKHSDVWAEVERFILPDTFKTRSFKQIFTAIRAVTDAGNPVDPTIISTELTRNNIVPFDDIDVDDYLDSLSHRPISRKATLNLAAEIFDTYIKRKACQNLRDVFNAATSSDFVKKPAVEFISEVEKLFSENINFFHFENQPKDLMDGAIDRIRDRGNNPVEYAGLKIPYPILQDMLGGWRPQGLTVISAPKKNNKSTFLAWTGLETARINPSTKVLYLDTEMSKDEVVDRLAAAYTGCSDYFFTTGLYRKNKKYAKRFEEVAVPALQAFEGLVDHVEVAGMSADEVMSVVRRWHHRNKNQYENFFIVYDYLKLTGNQRPSDHWKEYQVMGEICTKIKDLAKDLNSHVLAAAQTNEEGKTAISARISWFATAVLALRKKTPEVLGEHGDNWGTHTLETEFLRFHGPNRLGEMVLVEGQNDRGKRILMNNQIFYDMTNFKVQEVGTLNRLMNPHVDAEVVPDENDVSFKDDDIL